MNLQQLYYFKATAELEHYTQAAQSLDISQSCLSHSIGDLEQELGVALFVRQGRNVRLTRSGAFFLEYVQKALATLDEGKTRLQDFISSDTGVIRIGHLSSLSNFVPYMISRFFTETGKYQNRFQFDQGSTLHLEQQLLEGSSDIIISTPFDNPQIRSAKIGEHRTVLLVSKDHPLARSGATSVDLTAMANETFVTYNSQCQIRTYINEIFKTVGIQPTISFEAVNDPIIQGAVAANLGVALMPEASGQISNDLRSLTIENEIPTRDIHISWVADRYMTPAVKNFKEFVVSSEMILNQYKAKNLTE